MVKCVAGVLQTEMESTTAATFVEYQHTRLAACGSMAHAVAVAVAVAVVLQKETGSTSAVAFM